jgi:hypothetical protein
MTDERYEETLSPIRAALLERAEQRRRREDPTVYEVEIWSRAPIWIRLPLVITLALPIGAAGLFLLGTSALLLFKPWESATELLGILFLWTLAAIFIVLAVRLVLHGLLVTPPQPGGTRIVFGWWMLLLGIIAIATAVEQRSMWMLLPVLVFDALGAIALWGDGSGSAIRRVRRPQYADRDSRREAQVPTERSPSHRP